MIKKLIPKLVKKRVKYQLIYQQFRSYTMVPWHHFVKNLALAETIKYVEGEVVECGVWKGGMMAAIAKLLGNDKRYILFDSFEGLPPVKEIDGEKAKQWQSNPEGEYYHNNCKAAFEEANQAMQLSGAKNYRIYKGWFKETFELYEPAPIALLRLDADWYDATLLCLEQLFEYVVPNGLIIIDDYYTWDGCAIAVHEFLSKRKSTARIYSYENAVCYIKK